MIMKEFLLKKYLFKFCTVFVINNINCGCLCKSNKDKNNLKDSNNNSNNSSNNNKDVKKKEEEKDDDDDDKLKNKKKRIERKFKTYKRNV